MYKLDERDAQYADELRALGWEVEIRFAESDEDLPEVDDSETFGVEHWS